MSNSPARVIKGQRKFAVWSLNGTMSERCIFYDKEKASPEGKRITDIAVSIKKNYLNMSGKSELCIFMTFAIC